jgi:hypothetical protein
MLHLTGLFLLSDLSKCWSDGNVRLPAGIQETSEDVLELSSFSIGSVGIPRTNSLRDIQADFRISMILCPLI